MTKRKTDTGSDSGESLRDQLIRASLAHVPFDGWTRAALLRGAADIGFDKGEAEMLFPGTGPGVGSDMIAWHSKMADRAMLSALQALDMDSLKIRERIATAVMTRLIQNAGDREAVRRGLSVLSRPGNTALALRLLYQTVDDMWFAAGDRSSDWNFYSKRMLLGGVYSSTLMVWLNDNSEDFVETRAFLDRRIENVMQVPKLKAKLATVAGRIPQRMKGLRGFGAGFASHRGSR